MARVLVVSRNPVLAMGLSGSEHDVVELRPHTFGDWIGDGVEVDAFVLDLENPLLAVAALENLRAHDKLAPALLVSSDRPGWDDQSLHSLPGAEVLPLPVTRPALLAALEALLVRPAKAPSGRRPRHDDVVEALHELVVEPDGLLAADDADVPLPAPRHARPPEPEEEPPARVLAHAAETPDEARGTPVPPLTAVPRTQRRSRVPAADMSESLRELQALRNPGRQDVPTSRTEQSELPPGEPATASRPARAAESAIELVQRLRPVAGSLFGVPETAEIVITDAIERTGADAGAALVPDGERWRVAAGVGLRPIEHRYELSADSWLVEKVGRGHKGVIIEESDVAREQLHGAPLAGWRHLLAAPVPGIHAVLLLARREDPPFDEKALSLLASLGVEAQPLLTAAVDTRALARALWEFRDEDGPSPR